MKRKIALWAAALLCMAGAGNASCEEPYESSVQDDIDALNVEIPYTYLRENVTFRDEEFYTGKDLRELVEEYSLESDDYYEEELIPPVSESDYLLFSCGESQMVFRVINVSEQAKPIGLCTPIEVHIWDSNGNAKLPDYGLVTGETTYEEAMEKMPTFYDQTDQDLFYRLFFDMSFTGLTWNSDYGAELLSLQGEDVEMTLHFEDDVLVSIQKKGKWYVDKMYSERFAALNRELAHEMGEVAVYDDSRTGLHFLAPDATWYQTKTNVDSSSPSAKDTVRAIFVNDDANGTIIYRGENILENLEKYGLEDEETAWILEADPDELTEYFDNEEHIAKLLDYVDADALKKQTGGDWNFYVSGENGTVMAARVQGEYLHILRFVFFSDREEDVDALLATIDFGEGLHANIIKVPETWEEIREEYRFTLDGIEYQLPVHFSELAKNGWKIDYTDDWIGGYTDSSSSIVDKNGNHISVVLSNFGLNAIPEEEGYVTSINVNVDGVGDRFETYRGIRLGDKYDDVVAAYGYQEEAYYPDDYTYEIENPEYYDFFRDIGLIKLGDNEISFMYQDWESGKPGSVISSIRIAFTWLPEGWEPGTVSENLELPELYDSYEEPTELGDDLLSMNYEIGGHLYHFPTPVCKLQEGAFDEDFSKVLPGLGEDNIGSGIFVRNPLNEGAPAEYGYIGSLYLDDYYGYQLILPGGITYGTDLDDVLAKYPVFTEEELAGESCYKDVDDISYSYYHSGENYRTFEIGRNGISVELMATKDGHSINEIQLYSYGWDGY